MTIFVGIPSYRDRELLPTLKDLFARARWPNDIRVGVCWQHDDTETLDAFAYDPRVRVIDVPYLESRGLAWARSQYASLYAGEDFVLQLDSHHRFVADWDAKLIEMMGQVGAARPVITTYPPAYDPATGFREQDPTMMYFLGFTARGTITMQPVAVAELAECAKPVPSRFAAGGFSFSVGSFLEDVPPDPQMYFSGEEASMCVRGFTHGYDFFHPNKIICWHHYVRAGQPKHWDDHQKATTTPGLLELQGLARFRRLIGLDLPIPGEDFGRFGLGTERTLLDYQRFAGICYDTRGVDEHTLSGALPPGPNVLLDHNTWQAKLLKTHRLELTLDCDSLPQRFSGDAPWTLALTRSGDILHERTFSAEEMASLRHQRQSSLDIQYHSREPANGWMLSLLWHDGGRAVAIKAAV